MSKKYIYHIVNVRLIISPNCHTKIISIIGSFARKKLLTVIAVLLLCLKAGYAQENDAGLLCLNSFESGNTIHIMDNFKAGNTSTVVTYQKLMAGDVAYTESTTQSSGRLNFLKRTKMKHLKGFKRISGGDVIKVTPDESVNKNEFERHYALNPVFWDAAFDFLEKTDLDSIKPGKYDIIGKDVYASVEEYISKDEDKSRYEAHRRYADIQYVISGSEKIGVVPLSSTEENVPYNEVKDICFLKSEHDSYFNASPKNFFVFFPEDAHRPGVKIQEKIPVHKIVIKIKVN